MRREGARPRASATSCARPVPVALAAAAVAPPATAAREMGFTHTPMLCFNEIDVPGSLRQCIRILVQVNSEKSQREMKSIYLKEATVLRPDHANNISTINQAT